MQVNGAEEHEMTDILWAKMQKGEVSVLIQKIAIHGVVWWGCSLIIDHLGRASL